MRKKIEAVQRYLKGKESARAVSTLFNYNFMTEVEDIVVPEEVLDDTNQKRDCKQSRYDLPTTSLYNIQL